MRISELADAAGVTIATAKYYIREGMLPRGTPTAPTRADYGEEHVARLRLITALAAVRGLPLARVREVLALVDAPLDDPVETMGRAIGALPPHARARDDYPLARAAIEAMGLTYEPRFAAVAQLEAAIEAIEAAGLPWDEDVLRRYAEPMREIAGDEVAPIPAMARDDAVAYAVLGTALYEPLLLALRRLAHQHLLVTGEGR